MTSASHEALEALGHVQNELSVHSSASRAILTHLCQRLAQLETTVSTVQSEIGRLRTDSQQDAQGVRTQVSGVQAKVEIMSTQLNEYASVMDMFQNEMSHQKSSLTWLSSTLTDEQGRVNDVHQVRYTDEAMTPILNHPKGANTFGMLQKVDNQREDFNSRFTELSLKLEEIPRSVAVLLAPPTADRDASFTFRAADDKLSLQNHTRRLDGYSRGGDGGPYTDLQPFTIPDDMKAKVEMRIRQREQRKEEADALAAAELAEAYRRLQLANNPRLGEVRIQVDQCQEQIKRAFQMIRDSNLQLYSCCESKVEKMDFSAIQSELKALRSRLREVEISGPHRVRYPPTQSLGTLKQQQQPSGADSLMISTVKDRSLPMSSSPNQAMQLTGGQIPELRVSLLELSRNFNVLKLQWKKQHRQKGLNPVVKTHMEKVVAMINDAYSATAEEPVDLATVARHVEKVSRVLSSDFSMQILGTMGCRNPQEELLRRSIAANEIVPALCRYSELFTEYLRSDAQSNNNNNAQIAPASIESHHPAVDDLAGFTEMIGPLQHNQDQQHSLERMSHEMEELVRNQRRLEMTLAQLVSATGTAVTTNDVSASSTPSETLANFVKMSPAPNESGVMETSHTSDDLQRLREEIAAMRRHFVSEDTLGEVLRQLEVWKSDHEWNASGGGGGGVVVGHRYPSNLSKRQTNSSNLLDFGSSDPIDSLDRPKSQTKLDPLQIHKMNGELRPGRAQQQHSQPIRSMNPAAALTSNGGTVLSGRGSALSRLQARSQMLRPKSSALPQQPDQYT